MKKVLDVKSIQKKAIKKIKEAIKDTGMTLSDSSSKEILKAIEKQSVSNLEEIIAENLAMDIADNFNKRVKL